MEFDRNPKLSVSMSKEPNLEDFTTLSLLVVSIFSDSRRIGGGCFDGASVAQLLFRTLGTLCYKILNSGAYTP
jgi:hypothetical protein